MPSRSDSSTSTAGELASPRIHSTRASSAFEPAHGGVGAVEHRACGWKGSASTTSSRRNVAACDRKPWQPLWSTSTSA